MTSLYCTLSLRGKPSSIFSPHFLVSKESLLLSILTISKTVWHSEAAHHHDLSLNTISLPLFIFSENNKSAGRKNFRSSRNLSSGQKVGDFWEAPTDPEGGWGMGGSPEVRARSLWHRFRRFAGVLWCSTLFSCTVRTYNLVLVISDDSSSFSD